MSRTTQECLEKTSATQLQLVNNCEARWWFKYKENLPDYEAGPGAIRGTEGHDRLETYLTTGTNILDGLEALGIERGLVPAPGPDLLVEQPVNPGYDVLWRNQLWGTKPVYLGGVLLNGYIDLINPRLLASTGVLELTDWKFKKSISLYAARDEDLLDPTSEAGIQMISYCAWILANREFFPGMKRVKLRHVTFQTKGAKDVHESSVIADLQKIGNVCETVSQSIVPRLRVAAAATSASEVRRNTDFCEKFPPKGCPYKTACLDRTARIASRLKASRKGAVQMGMLSSVMNKPSTPSAPTAPAPIPNASAPAAPTPPTPKITIKDESTTPELRAGAAVQGTKYVVNGQVATFLCNFSRVAGRPESAFIPVDGGAPVHVPSETFILPLVESAAPVATPSSPAAGPAPVTATPATTAVQSDPAPEAVKASTTVAAAAPAEQESPIVAPAEAPKKRGRPKKTDAENGGQSAAPSSPTPAPAIGLDGVFLYIGCSPVGVKTDTLYPYALEVQRLTVKEGIEAGVKGLDEGTDLRTCSDSVFGFNKWQAYFEEACGEVAIAPGHYIVTSGDARIEAAARALTAILPAGHVIMGGAR